MTNYYQPDIELDGRPLDTSAVIEGVTVLGTFAIDWGTDSWLSDNPGSTLTLTLLDPAGELLPLVGGSGGHRIAVSRQPDGIIWRGELQDAEAELVKLPRAHDPRESRYVWRVTLTATDPLATLASDRKHGPPPAAIAPGPTTFTHWGPTTYTDRFIDLASRCPVPLVFEPHPEFPATDVWDPAVKPLAPVAGYEKQQNVSVLTVLHRSMRMAHLLARPYYLPSRDAIHQVTPRRADELVPLRLEPLEPPAQLALVAPAGVLDVVPINSQAFKQLRGSQFVAPDGVRIAADPDTRITQVERVGRVEKQTDDPKGGKRLAYEEYSETVSTGMKDREVCTASFEHDLSAAYWDADASRWHQREFFRRIFTRTGPGRLTYRLPVSSAPVAGADVELIRPEPPHVYRAAGGITPARYTDLKTCYLVGSLTNLVPNAGPFAIIGGTLTYHAETGWTHDIDTAPIAEATPIRSAALTLGDITLTTPIESAEPTLMIADLEHISQA